MLALLETLVEIAAVMVPLVLCQALLLACVVPGLRDVTWRAFAGPRRVRTAFWSAVGSLL